MAAEAKNEPFHITVNDQYSIDVLPDEAHALDVVPDGPARYHVLHQGHAFWVETMHADCDARTFAFRIDGQVFTVQIADFYTRLVQQLGMAKASGHRSNVVKAPMPGLVLQVLVAPGQSVQKGDPLLILEAMKMENVLKAANEGMVKEVLVQGGQTVEKGSNLVVLQ